MGIGLIALGCCTTSRMRYRIGVEGVLWRSTLNQKVVKFISTYFLWRLNLASISEHRQYCLNWKMERMSTICYTIGWSQLDVPSGIRAIQYRDKGKLGLVYEAAQEIYRTN